MTVIYVTYFQTYNYRLLEHELPKDQKRESLVRKDSFLLSVRYAISSLTIGRNSTKFGV